MSKKSNRVIKGALRSLYRWHRRVAIASVLFVFLLAITGIILNHNTDLNLHKTPLKSQWIHDWYNLPMPEENDFYHLTMDRVLLDIHTGRFFGPWGPYVMDLAALCFLILAGTGFYMWWHRYNEKNRRKK